MDEYIKREAAQTSCRKYSFAESYDAFAVDCILKAIPAADVAPVRHGRWIDKGEYAVCTECGGRSGTQYDGVEPIPLMTQFCPNCGANMESEE